VSANSCLPKNVREYFWDYPSVKLSLKSDCDLIIRRLLISGSWDSIQWLRKKIGDANLRDWLVTHRGRGLSPRQLRFWGLMLDIPEKQVDDWVKASRETIWENK
jgi:hypothetical protein